MCVCRVRARVSAQCVPAEVCAKKCMPATEVLLHGSTRAARVLLIVTPITRLFYRYTDHHIFFIVTLITTFFLSLHRSPHFYRCTDHHIFYRYTDHHIFVSLHRSPHFVSLHRSPHFLSLHRSPHFYRYTDHHIFYIVSAVNILCLQHKQHKQHEHKPPPARLQ